MDFLARDWAISMDGKDPLLPEYMYQRAGQYLQPAEIDELDVWLMKNVRISGREEYLRLKAYLLDSMRENK